MAVPAKKNQAFTFEVLLVSQADTDIFKSSPTIAAGDFALSGDGGALTPLTNTPTASGKMVTVALTQAEMNYDRVLVVASDQAGDEWQDAAWEIFTSSTQIGDPVTVGAISAAGAATFFTVDSTKAYTDAVNGSVVAEILDGVEAGELTASAVWANPTRTLTVNPHEIEDVVTAGDILTIYNHAAMSKSITGFDAADLAAAANLIFTVKPKADNETAQDAAATIQIDSDTGLLRIAGRAGTAANGSLTVASGTVTVALDAVEAAKLTAGSKYLYDLKIIRASGVEAQILTAGQFVITQAVGRALA